MIRVFAPASTANVGPGFDCLAGALSVGLVVTAAKDGDGDRSDLIQRAVRCVTGDDIGVEITTASTIPAVAAGLGSSAAAIAAGLVVGSAIMERSLPAAELLRLGLTLEGHPDNLAAAIYGGLTISVPDGDTWDVVRIDPPVDVRPFVLVAADRLATTEARGALPQQVALSAAVANIARTAGLVAVLSGGVEATRERLLACTDDLLHQPARAALMPKTAEALSVLRAAGVPAAVSGAGPSIVCLVVSGEEEATRDAVTDLEDFELHELDWEPRGAHLLH